MSDGGVRVRHADGTAYGQAVRPEAIDVQTCRPRCSRRSASLAFANERYELCWKSSAGRLLFSMQAPEV